MYKTGLLTFCGAGLVFGTMFVGAICYHESNKLDEMIDDLPPIEYDYEFMGHLNECKKKAIDLSQDECDTIFGVTT